MCGNNNGNPSDDAPGYEIYLESQLFASMHVTPQTDLWAWKPTTTVTAPTLPSYAQECVYVAPVVSKPIISYGGMPCIFVIVSTLSHYYLDANDITALLKAVAPLGTPQPLSKFQFNDSVISFTTQQPFNMTEANITCRALLIDSKLGKACAQFPQINLQGYVDNCLINLQLAGVNVGLTYNNCKRFAGRMCWYCWNRSFDMGQKC
jgi:hypothetical protein